MELTTGGTVEDLLDKAPYKDKSNILEGVYYCLEHGWRLNQSNIQAAALALPPYYENLMQDLRCRCQELAKPFIRKAAHHVLHIMNIISRKEMQEDFARRGMSFVDQLSIMHAKGWPWDSVSVGFKQYMDSLIEYEISKLNDAERLYVDYRDIGLQPFEESTKRLAKDIEDTIVEALEKHYQTQRIQRFLTKAKL